MRGHHKMSHTRGEEWVTTVGFHCRNTKVTCYGDIFFQITTVTLTLTTRYSHFAITGSQKKIFSLFPGTK